MVGISPVGTRTLGGGTGAGTQTQSISLGVTDGSAIYAPEVRSNQTISLPVTDDSAIYGPTANIQIRLPLIDGSALYAPSISRPLTLSLGLLDGGFAFAPRVSSTDTPTVSSGLTVKTYSRAGSLLATLDESHTRRFLDQIDDTGTFSLVLQNDDADLTNAGFDRIVRFEVAGQARFSGVIQNREIVTYAPGESHDEVTTLSGPGALAVLGEARVYPSRGVSALPIEEVRSFSWSAPDFDDSGWPTAKALSRQDQATSGWDATNPEAWPTPAAYRIWGDVDTASTVHAPTGTCLFRDTFTVTTAGPHAFFAAWDNLGELYVDGAKVMVGQPDYVKARKVVIDLSAGTHYVASLGTNGTDVGTPLGQNPAYFLAACHPIDRQGLLDAAIWTTDSTVKCLPYVTGLPGWTAGKALRLLVEAAQADSKLTGLTLDFTDTVASDGEPWNLYAELSAGVGRSSLLDVVREMADSIIDVAMAPGALKLRAWNFGTRGLSKAVNLQNTTSVSTSQLTDLSHRGQRTRVNALLIRYAGGYTEVTDTSSISTYGRFDDYLELGWVQSETEAQRIGTEHLATRSAPQYATTAGINPSGDSTTPYVGFDVGDSPQVIDSTGALAEMRCRSIALNELDTGLLQWSSEFNAIALELETRHENWLRRMDAGTLAGGSRVASPAASAPITDETLSSVRVAEFSYQGTVGILSVVALYLNGVSLGSVTFSSGDDQVLALSLNKVHGDTDYLQVAIDGVLSQRRPAETSGNLISFAVSRTVAADGTEGFDAQARAI